MLGDCRDRLKELPDNSIDSIVTDPPYELGFMGKSWDASGVAYDVTVWKECLRVLKPGGHLLSFGGSRTYHRMACAIEDAGFQIRDQIMWVYGSGFPKSLNISKAIDKAAGAEREVIGQKLHARKGVASAEERTVIGAGAFGEARMGDITAPSTAEAKEWDGWGTALKPAHEPIVLARKPLDGTVANNVLTHGVGGINIDGCRVASDDGFEKAWDKPVSTNISAKGGTYISQGAQHIVDISSNKPVGGRFPANVIHDGSDEVLQRFPDSKGMATQKSGSNIKVYGGNSLYESSTTFPDDRQGFNDNGSAARFFYCAKASKKDRNEGLDNMPLQQPVGGADKWTEQDRRRGEGVTRQPSANHHPTVKPTELMRYLCRLITPPNGTVLDPFTGSGSTGKAAVLEGFNFIGVEQSAEYIEIAKARIEAAE
jgi:site-specific DNA-methyltransferase (adenine-specific)